VEADCKSNSLPLGSGNNAVDVLPATVNSAVVNTADIMSTGNINFVPHSTDNRRQVADLSADVESKTPYIKLVPIKKKPIRRPDHVKHFKQFVGPDVLPTPSAPADVESKTPYIKLVPKKKKPIKRPDYVKHFKQFVGPDVLPTPSAPALSPNVPDNVALNKQPLNTNNKISGEPIQGLAFNGRYCIHNPKACCQNCVKLEFNCKDLHNLPSHIACGVCNLSFRNKYGAFDIDFTDYTNPILNKERSKLLENKEVHRIDTTLKSVKFTETDDGKVVPTLDEVNETDSFLLGIAKNSNLMPDIVGIKAKMISDIKNTHFPVIRGDPDDKPAGSFLLGNLDNRIVFSDTRVFKVRQAVQHGYDLRIYSNDSNLPSLLGGFFGEKEIFVEMPSTVIDELSVYWTNPIKRRNVDLLNYEQTQFICKELIGPLYNIDAEMYFNTLLYAPLVAYYTTQQKNAGTFALIGNNLWLFNYLFIFAWLFAGIETLVLDYKFNLPFLILFSVIIVVFFSNNHSFRSWVNFIKLKILIVGLLAVINFSLNIFLTGLLIYEYDYCVDYHYWVLTVYSVGCNKFIIILTVLLTFIIIFLRFISIYSTSKLVYTNQFGYVNVDQAIANPFNIDFANANVGILSHNIYRIRRQIKSCMNIVTLVGIIEIWIIGFAVPYWIGFPLYLLSVRFNNASKTLVSNGFVDINLW